MLNLHASLMKRGRLAVDIASASRNRPQLSEMSSTSYFLASSRKDVILPQLTWLSASYMPLISRRVVSAVSSSCSLAEDGKSKSRPLHRECTHAWLQQLFFVEPGSYGSHQHLGRACADEDIS